MSEVIIRDLPGCIRIWKVSELTAADHIHATFPVYDVHYEQNGKPVLQKKDTPEREILSFSKSHTSGFVVWGINEKGDIGIDIEKVNRPVHDGLFHRIKHPDEDEGLFSNLIRIWTLKESVLKLIGSGLRTPMSGIRIQKKESDSFFCNLGSREINVVSVQYQDLWISVAFTTNGVK